MVNFSSENCKHFKGTVVLVRSAQTTHVVYTLCAELVFWCWVIILGVMIAITCTCTVLVFFYCVITQSYYLGRSWKVSHKFWSELKKKTSTKLESELKKFQVSWISKPQITPRSHCVQDALHLLRAAAVICKDILSNKWHFNNVLVTAVRQIQSLQHYWLW